MGLGYAALAVALCFVPLFQTVGYESAALFAVVAGVCATFWPLHATGSAAVSALWRAGLHVALLGFPLAVLAANGWRVVNCDPGLGLKFWGILTAVSVVYGTSVRAIIEAFVARGRRRVWASLAAFLMSVAAFAWQLAMEPPINGFQVYLGYFSGSIYDEALSISPSLLVYRAWTLLFAAALLAVAEAKQRWTQFGHVWGATWLACGLVFASAAGWSVRRDAGIDLDRETIGERLGGYVETQHFQIYFPATRDWLRQAPLLAEDHEFRYAQMKAYFGTDPVADSGRKVRSFVYADRSQKGDLMGGRRTLVAKLWLGEMHILWREFGDHLLAHELAHIFTEPFGAGPLRLSSRFGVFVNMGLVEGIATAADWPAGDLDVHQAAAALRRMDAAPDIRRLLGASGFWTQSSARAYTLMGSFIAFVVDRHGIDAFKRAYPHGDFEAAYGQPVDALVAQWEAYLDGLPLSDADMARAHFQYDRPSIFEKVCARAVAELRRQAEEQAQMGEATASLNTYRQILAMDPANTRHRLEFVGFLLQFEQVDAARAELDAVLSGDVSEGERALALDLLGDVMWRKQDIDGALKSYRSCAELGIGNDQRRMIATKMAALASDAPTQALAFAYLVEPDEGLGAYWPAMWLKHAPDDPLGHYLLARRLAGAGRFADAATHLAAAQGLPEALVPELAHQRMRVAYFLGDFEGAEAQLATLRSASMPYPTIAAEWDARIAWARRNSIERR